MKKFQFSLEKLLSYKGQLLDVERGVLADMHARLSALQTELESLQSEMRGSADSLNRRYAEGVTPIEIMHHKGYLHSLGESAQQREWEITLQLQAIDRQSDRVREAKIELSTIEKLKEKKFAEYAYLENKAQELFIEEFVSTQRMMAATLSI